MTRAVLLSRRYLIAGLFIVSAVAEWCFSQRIIAFIICIAIGAVMLFVAFFFLLGAVTGSSTFAVSFAISNLAFMIGYDLQPVTCNVNALCRAGFLIGPKRQLKSCFEPSRVVASLVYIAALILTFICALVVRLPAPAQGALLTCPSYSLTAAS